MILETDRLYLRNFELSDAYRMSEYRNKEIVSKYQSWNQYSIEDAKKRILECMQVKEYGTINTDYHLAIILKEEDKLIGDLFVEVLNKKIIALGYTLDDEYWHHGYATEIIKSFCTYMKENYHFKKVVCYVYVDNKNSKRLLKRLGFMKFDESLYYDDEGYIKKL